MYALMMFAFLTITIVHVHGADSCDGAKPNTININVADMWQNHGKCGEVTCSKSWGAQLSGAVDANTSLGICRGRTELGHETFCELPNRVVNITFTVVNTGVSSWPAAGMVVRLLTFNETYGNIAQAIVTSGPVETGQSLKVSVQVRTVATVEGVWPLHFGLFGPCGRFGDDIIIRLQSTCSDQYFCNGVERLINGVCVPATSQACDDQEPCTTDVCDEFWQRCTHRVNATDPNCHVCNVDCRAEATCVGKECGPDGCIGSCGTCSSGRACVAGKCEAVSAPGTCTNPIPLPNATVIGFHRFIVDTSQGVNNVIPSCNQASAAADLVYTFTVTQAQADAGLYFDGRVSDIRMPLDNEAAVEDLEPAIIDTVLEVRLNGCGESDAVWAINKNAWCSDDATPPGGLGSRVNIKLSAGRYYVILDGYSDINVGVVQFEYKFLTYKPVCDGTFCGDDGRGGDCGPCNTTTHTCAANRRCISRTCVPDCAGKACGPDGCGNYCGSCSNGTLCTFATGTCDVFPICNHLTPTCGTGCTNNQYCAANCSCIGLNTPLPDLVVDVETLMTQLTVETIDFSAQHCGVVEGCISKAGIRRLFRFSVAVMNQGTGPLVLPSPPSRPDEFMWGACHAHFHFKGFARYTLLQSNRVILRGAKEAYCMEDSARSVTFQGPSVPCKPASTCSAPGIQVGWVDFYGQDLDCQWIDITNIKPGLYTLRIELNEERNLLESNYDNNVVDIPVMIPATDGALVNMGPPAVTA